MFFLPSPTAGPLKEERSFGEPSYGLRFHCAGLCRLESEGVMSPRIGVFVGILSILAISGCIGGYVSYPVECQSDYPLKYYLYRKDAWGPIGNFGDLNPSGNPLTKGDFLREWGNPDEIVPVSSNRELWAYNRSRFCGIMPIYIVPVPLGLPICDEFDHITFENDRAVHIHFRRVNAVGFVFVPMVTGDVSGETICPGEHIPSEREISMLPCDPSIISIPHTESCQKLAFTDGFICWTDGPTVTKVDPVSREIVEKVSVAGQKFSVFDRATGFDARWEPTGGKKKSSLTRTDLKTGTISAVIPLVRPAVLVVTGKEAVWVLHDRLLSRIDPQTNRVISTLSINLPLLHLGGKMVVGDQSVWVASGSTLIRIDPLKNDIVGTFQIVLDTELRSNYYSVMDMVEEAGSLWILISKASDRFFDANYFRIGLAEFDLSTNTLREPRLLGSGDSWAVSQGPWIAATGDAVWACLPLGIYVIPKCASDQTNEALE